jgi:hypothetical protein
VRKLTVACRQIQPGSAVRGTETAVLGTQVEKERPPEGLARGRYEAPAWLIAALGGVIAFGALAFLIARFVRRSRAARGDFVPPSKRRP